MRNIKIIDCVSYSSRFCPDPRVKITSFRGNGQRPILSLEYFNEIMILQRDTYTVQ